MTDRPSIRLLLQVRRGVDFERLLDKLGELGFVVERSLPSVGVIGGYGPETLRSDLKSLTEVMSVRVEGEARTF